MNEPDGFPKIGQFMWVGSPLAGPSSFWPIQPKNGLKMINIYKVATLMVQLDNSIHF